MIDVDRIRGILFDYGGTIDSNGVHWAEVIWQAYLSEDIPITKESFREAYIHGERTLGKNPLVKPYHTFLDMMRLKIDIQFEWLSIPQDAVSNTRHCEEGRRINPNLFENECFSTRKHRIADFCYAYARSSVECARPVINWIADKYPIALVSNFYGNIAAVLQDFEIDRFFPIIIESAVVGVRKPDPQIFRLGIEALQMKAAEVVVIGDSHDKDIIPAEVAGCQTIWLKNTGWNEYAGNEEADLIIADFSELIKWL